MSSFEESLSKAIQARLSDVELLSSTNAYRIFNGVFEGEPGISVDIFDSTAVIHEFDPNKSPLSEETAAILKNLIPSLSTIILKQRKAKDPARRNGIVLIGDQTTVEIHEFDAKYHVDLTMNHDSGFYLDTALLRKWLGANTKGKRFLNTFAYTGSLGIAGLSGGAEIAIQQDKSKVFLNIARRSAALNGFPPASHSTLAQDYFPATANFRKQKREFDLVLLDPPFFSTTGKGKVSLEHDFLSLINKARPLVADQGHLIFVNNALFLSGEQLMNVISPIFSDGYITIQETIPVPRSFVGYHPDPGSVLPADPTPFGHSTKILILKVAKK